MRSHCHLRQAWGIFALAIVWVAAAAPASAQDATVIIPVQVVQPQAQKKDSPRAAKDSAGVVVWLRALDSAAQPPPSSSGPKPQLIQRNKAFEPHLLVVPVGAEVEFPNRDPFFHNVFSTFDGKRFDLGLYEGGASNSVRFARPGVSFLFCNIHPEMSAVVIAVDTPFYGVSDQNGRVVIHNVPDGRYEVHVFYERTTFEDLKQLTVPITISAAVRELKPLQIPESADFTSNHKNKYGKDYTPAAPASYARP